MFKFVLQKPGSKQKNKATKQNGSAAARKTNIHRRKYAEQVKKKNLKGNSCERTVVHDRTRQLRHAHVARFLLEFANGALLGSFPGIDQAGRYFDDDFVDRRTVLLLQK